MMEVIDLVWKWAVPFLLGGLVGVVGKQWATLHAFKFGLVALLRDRIYQAYSYYHEVGYYPIPARENVEEMYKQYHALGGNGTVTKLVNSMSDLPTEPKSGVSV